VISYTKKALKLLRSRIQRLGAPAHVIEAMTLEMLVNLYKMSKRLSASGLLTRYREREAGLLVERARGRVLDAGCGIGKLAYSLALANPDLAVLGVDIDEEKIEIAREVAEGRRATSRSGS
jgi:2-polyprenyl-3-methyl-5-hydroxy-6-metoxy-1,4-benzoquinol methylase